MMAKPHKRSIADIRDAIDHYSAAARRVERNGWHAAAGQLVAFVIPAVIH